MPQQQIVSRDEWLVARKEFLAREEAAAERVPYFTSGEQGGTSVFLRDGDRVFRTYSTYGPGCELLHGTYHYLDLTPLGRQNDDVIRYHDRYTA